MILDRDEPAGLGFNVKEVFDAIVTQSSTSIMLA